MRLNIIQRVILILFAVAVVTLCVGFAPTSAMVQKGVYLFCGHKPIFTDFVKWRGGTYSASIDTRRLTAELAGLSLVALALFFAFSGPSRKEEK